jgi:TRAP-type uncharacterized transport system substrate-binding protein
LGNIKSLKGSHAVIEQFDVKKALLGTSGIDIPPDEEKYYKEIGLLK